MTEREALTAALAYYDSNDKAFVISHVPLYIAAARERLAQLPEKCEHGLIHAGIVLEFGVTVGAGAYEPVEWCSGRVYPAELVERIAETIVASWERVFADYRGLKAEAPGMAVAVLDALNRETP